jgi:chromosome segregation ATPase
MEESLKNRFIMILALLTVIFFIGTISSCSSSLRNKNSLNKEMTLRLELEEKMSKFNQDKTAVEKQIAAVTQQLEEEKAAHQASKKTLLQEQLVNQSLKEELQKVTRLKEALEEDLKEALVISKPAKSKQ